MPKSKITQESNMQHDTTPITPPSVFIQNDYTVVDRLSHASIDSLPDPFDPAQFAVQGTISGGMGVIKEMVTCPVRKPSKQEFFRVHPGQEYQLQSYILELRDERETYLVMPSVAMELPGEIRVVDLRLAISRQGAIFLWPLPTPGIDGRENHWWNSARIAAGRAELAWTRMVANMPQGAYDIFFASGSLQEPVWPDKPLREILKIAFGERFIIRDSDHPVIQRLMGMA